VACRMTTRSASSRRRRPLARPRRRRLPAGHPLRNYVAPRSGWTVGDHRGMKTSVRWTTTAAANLQRRPPRLPAFVWLVCCASCDGAWQQTVAPNRHEGRQGIYKSNTHRHSSQKHDHARSTARVRGPTFRQPLLVPQ
jgi:hypothetical protein